MLKPCTNCGDIAQIESPNTFCIICRLSTYETIKRNIPKDLTPQEYERRIKDAANKSGV